MLFLLPFLVFMLAIFFVPVAYVVWDSFVSRAGHFTFDFYGHFFTNPLYVGTLVRTIEISVVATFLTVIFAYPVAYYLAKQPFKKRMYLSTLLLLPFYTSILVKSFAFQIILGFHGVINDTLRLILGDWAVLSLINNRVGVYIGIMHDMLPFLVFPILVSLLSQNPSLPRAAAIMGASRTRIFWKVIFPLSLPGVYAGVLLVMVRVMGQYAVPALLGGPRDAMMANIVVMQVNDVLDWNMAAVISMVLLLVSGIFLVMLTRVRNQDMLSTKG